MSRLSDMRSLEMMYTELMIICKIDQVVCGCDRFKFIAQSLHIEISFYYFTRILQKSTLPRRFQIFNIVLTFAKRLNWSTSWKKCRSACVIALITANIHFSLMWYQDIRIQCFWIIELRLLYHYRKNTIFSFYICEIACWLNQSQ